MFLGLGGCLLGGQEGEDVKLEWTNKTRVKYICIFICKYLRSLVYALLKPSIRQTNVNIWIRGELGVKIWWKIKKKNPRSKLLRIFLYKLDYISGPHVIFFQNRLSGGHLQYNGPLAKGRKLYIIVYCSNFKNLQNRTLPYMRFLYTPPPLSWSPR